MNMHAVGAPRAGLPVASGGASGTPRGGFDLLAARELKLGAGEPPMAAWHVAGVDGTSSASLTLSGIGDTAGGMLMLMLTLSGASAQPMPTLRVTGIEGPGGIAARFFGQTASAEDGEQCVDAHFAFPAQQVARWPAGTRLLALVEVGDHAGSPQRVKIPAPAEIVRG